MKLPTLVIAAVLCLPSGCSKGPSLVGTWRSSANGYAAQFILQLDSQGKGSLHEASQRATAKNDITWSEDGGNLRISKGWRTPDRFKIVTLSQTDLVIVGPDHVTLNFTRLDD